MRTGFLLARRLAAIAPRSTAWGAATWLAVALLHLAPWIPFLCIPGGTAWLLPALAALKFSAALELLHQHAQAAAKLLEEEDIAGARREAGEIVRRRLDHAQPGAVASAAIESVAENLVDGYTGPITYYPLLGPLGSLLYRIANTMDAALGYKTPEYRKVGAFSAHVDTILNLAPFRLTAALIVLLSPIVGGSPKKAMKAWLAWRSATPSINAGHTIAAMAGALNIRLWKEGVYTINPEGREPNAEDVKKAIRLSKAVAVAYLVITIAVASTITWVTS